MQIEVKNLHTGSNSRSSMEAASTHFEESGSPHLSTTFATPFSLWRASITTNMQIKIINTPSHTHMCASISKRVVNFRASTTTYTHKQQGTSTQMYKPTEFKIGPSTRPRTSGVECIHTFMWINKSVVLIESLVRPRTSKIRYTQTSM